MKLKKVMMMALTAAIVTTGVQTAVFAESVEKSAGSCFEAAEYEKVNVSGNVSKNEEAPDFTSFGGTFSSGDYIKYADIDFESGEYQTMLLSASALSGQENKKIEVRIDSQEGMKIGTCSLLTCSSAREFKECYTDISDVSGIHDVYFVFPEDAEANLDFFTFSTFDGEKDSEEENDARMKWWRDARYGQFIHFGAYAQLGGVYNGRTNSYAEWIMSDLGISRSDYEKAAVAPFNPTEFDAKEIVQLAKDAGQKYIVFTSRHHEGLSMFDTNIRGFKDYSLFSACNDGAYTGVDPVAELAKECETEGVDFGVYYTIMEWHDSSQTGIAFQTTINDKEEYKTRMKGQLRELIENYHVKVLFFDGEWVNWWTKADGQELYKYLRTLDPDIVVNNRVGKRNQDDGDYGTPEQEIPATGLDYDWESCMTLNNSWGYHKNDNNWKNANTVIDNLVICASKGGNYLLNVGPDEKGNVPEKSMEILRDAGTWLAKYGDSVYGTRVSCFKKLPSGVYATTKDGKVYIHMTNDTLSSEIVIPGLKNDIQDVKIMGTENSLSYDVIRGDIYINLSDVEKEVYDTVIEISVDGIPEEKESVKRNNLAISADRVSGTNQYSDKFAPSKAIDNDDSTRWATQDNTSSADLILEYDTPITVNSARIVNYNKPNTKNWVKNYSIDYWNGENWVAAIEKTEMGDEENLEFSDVTSQKFRLHITNASNPSIYEFQLFYQETIDVQITKPEILPAATSRPEGIPICTPQTEFSGTYTGGSQVYVQVKGNNYTSKSYQADVKNGTWTIKLDNEKLFGKYDVKATLKDAEGSVQAVDTISVYFRETENLAQGKAVRVSSYYSSLDGFNGEAAVDGYIGTRWSPADSDTTPWMIIDFGEKVTFDKVVISELFDTWNTPNDYRCQRFSLEVYDENGWETIHEGTKIGEEKVIDLKKSVGGSKIRLNILENRILANGSQSPTNILELEVYNSGYETMVNPFKDVLEESYYYDPVMWAVKNNITQGRTEDEFRPKEDCTRAQVVTFLWRAAGSPEPTSAENPFKDVSEAKYKHFYKAILWAKENKITDGYRDKTFRPEQAVTRAEFVTFLYRASGCPKVENTNLPFVDVNNVAHKNFINAIAWAYENEITLGKDASHFQPDISCSRANVVTFLYRGMAE